MDEPPTVPPLSALTTQLLAWVAERPRTYAEAMEAWRTSCPRMSIWEDAAIDGLVVVRSGEKAASSEVVLTPLGRAALARRPPRL